MWIIKILLALFISVFIWSIIQGNIFSIIGSLVFSIITLLILIGLNNRQKALEIEQWECPDCGHIVKQGDKFCPHCGVEFKE
jgi:hypothetical protein